MSTLINRFRRLPAARQGWWIIAAFLLLQTAIWVGLFEILWFGDKTITDTPLYYKYANRIFEGMWPYRDFASEYPPVAMLIITVPRLLSGLDYGAFVFWFEAEMLAMSAAITLLLALVIRRRQSGNRSLAATLGLYTFFLVSLGAIVKARFDLAAALIILASLVSYWLDRRRLAWILVGVGVMTKIVPALLGPLFLIALLRRRQMAELFWGPSLAAVTALLIALPFLVSAPAGLANAFLYHAERPLQLESSWSSPLLLLHRLAGYPVQIMNSYGSHNVFASWSDALAWLSGPVTLLALLLGYWLFWRQGGSYLSAGKPWPADQLFRFGVIAVATFIVGGKVFSPQFLIWLLPLVPLIEGRDRRWTIIGFSLVLMLTQWEFPMHYWQLFLLQTGTVVEVALRNATLALLVVSLLYHSQVRPAVELQGDRLQVASENSLD